jgi:RNA polymerase sigma-B factor
MTPDSVDRSQTAALVTEYLATGDRRLRNQVVEAHLDIADFYAKRYARRGVSPDDLRQVALLSMVRAVDRFDPEHGVEFSTFASRTVDGELKRYFRDRTWTVRPPRRAQELHLALRAANEELTQRLGRSPTVAELARETDHDVDHVLEALEAGRAHGATSLDQPFTSDEPDDSRGAERMLADAEGGYDQIDRRMVVAELLAELPERDRAIIEMRFFQNRNQEDIANEIGVSQSYLSRIIRRVLLDLREQLGEDWENELD